MLPAPVSHTTLSNAIVSRSPDACGLWGSDYRVDHRGSYGIARRTPNQVAHQVANQIAHQVAHHVAHRIAH
ncbi:hypothetical protein BH23GEM11_BH23GEM11_03150 [soil metagenome]